MIRRQILGLGKPHLYKPLPYFFAENYASFFVVQKTIFARRRGKRRLLNIQFELPVLRVV